MESLDPRAVDAAIAKHILDWTDLDLTRRYKAHSFEDMHCYGGSANCDCVEEWGLGRAPWMSKEACIVPIPHFSTTWDGAGMVIEGVGRKHSPEHVGPLMLHQLRACYLGKWRAQFCSDFGYTEPATADMGPMAVALAALAAYKIRPITLSEAHKMAIAGLHEAERKRAEEREREAAMEQRWERL